MSNKESTVVKTVFIDGIGRTIVGDENKKKSTKAQLAVDNPAVVFVQPNPDSGQIQVQVIPLFFRELVSEELRDTQTWYFNRASLVTNPTLVPDAKLCEQYDRVVGAGPEVPPGIVVDNETKSDPKVVKLFDEDDAKTPTAATEA